jgi:aryl-alcohol dehydrogenase-like predicted oxidoreductase
MGDGRWRLEFAWGPQNDQDSIAAIHEALDRGINWIDTAAVYALGHSEEVVARTLEGRSTRPYVFTKCSMTWDHRATIGHSLKADSIGRECEASLRRLRLDVIDLYQIHWPQPDREIEEGWTQLAHLQQEGKVRWIGVSNFNLKQMRRAQAIAPITSLQPPYSLLSRSSEDNVLPYAKRNNIGVIVYSPMYSGLLSGAMTRARVAGFAKDDWCRGDPNFLEPLLTRNLRLASLLRDVGGRYGRTAGEAAIAWTLRTSAVTAAIVGVRNRHQGSGIIGAEDFHLKPKEVEEIAGALHLEFAQPSRAVSNCASDLA